MDTQPQLKSSIELAKQNGAHFPNESAEYRLARNALLAEEIELRRHIERVSQQRRALPPGGAVPANYRFEGESGFISLQDLFGQAPTLVAYSFMYGPNRERPCPMCTSLVASWDHKIPDSEQRTALVVIARSPIKRLTAFKKERGWSHIKFLSDVHGDYTHAYVSAEDADIAAYNVFTRRDSTVRHFWSAEMGPGTADSGQDPRGAPDLDPLWTILDTTPEGRPVKWYPKLSY